MFDDGSGWAAGVGGGAGGAGGGVDWSTVDLSQPAPRPGGLPDTIEILPPGAELGAVLAGVDRSRLADPDLVAVAVARWRQISHLQAQLMADLVAVADRCVPRLSVPPSWGCGRAADPVDHAVEEIAAAMSWTQQAAGRQLDVAETLLRGLPMLHEAMLAGELDWPKAKVCADAVRDLDPALAHRVLATVLPAAPTRTTAQLRARLARLVIKADPQAAERRYRRRLTGRRVEHGQDEAGTARLSGRQLPVERAAAANARVQAIADWIKTSGDPRTLDQIRADILLDLLQGLPVPGPDGQDHHPLPGDPNDPDGDDGDDWTGNPDSDPDVDDVDEVDDVDDEPGQHDHTTRGGGGDAGDGGAGDDHGRVAGGQARGRRPDPGRSDQRGADQRGRGRRRAGRRGACTQCGQTKLTRGLELTAPVTTLLGLAEHPGQLGSWGPVIAEAARALVGDLIDAPWRISLTDDHGQVIWHGPIRARPSPTDRRRHPTASQAAYLRARDRRCRFPTCRRPAACAEIDHTMPHAQDGPTDVPNMACLCVRHHALKTAGVWKAHQCEEGGTIIWTSHLARTYVTHPETIDDDIPTNH